MSRTDSAESRQAEGKWSSNLMEQTLNHRPGCHAPDKKRCQQEPAEAGGEAAESRTWCG